MKNKILESLEEYQNMVDYVISLIKEINEAELDKDLSDEEKKDKKQRLKKLYQDWFKDIDANKDYFLGDMSKSIESKLTGEKCTAIKKSKSYLGILNTISSYKSYMQVKGINLSTAMIDYKNNTESMKKIDFDAKLINLDSLTGLLDNLKNTQLKDNQKIELNLMCNLNEEFKGHFTPIVIRKTSQGVKLFAIEAAGDKNVFYNLKNYQDLDINIIIPERTMQKDNESCFFYAISQLRILAQLSDDELNKYFEKNYFKNNEHKSTQEDLFQIPAMVKYTQSISQLDDVKNEPRIKERLHNNVKKNLSLSSNEWGYHQIQSGYNKIINGKNLTYYDVYYDYKPENHSIHYYKKSLTNKTIEHITKKEEKDLENITSSIILSENNIKDYINSRIKNEPEYNKNKCPKKYVSDLMTDKIKNEQNQKSEMKIKDYKATKERKERKPISNIKASRLFYFTATAASLIIATASAITAIIFSSIDKIRNIDVLVPAIGTFFSGLLALATFGGKIVELKQKDVNEVEKWNKESPAAEHISEIGTFVKLISKIETKNHSKSK
jgi:hypothetical protein